MSVIDQHKAEAANLALEHYELTQRMEQIDRRMGELAVIIKTAEHYEAMKEEKPDE